MQETDLERIEEKVRTLADAALSNGRPFLLSALGKDLGSDLNLIKAQTGSGLSRFIQDRMADEFSIVLGGEHRNVQAIVRAGSIDHGEGANVDLRPHVSVRPPRYHYKFWAAFAVPLEAGKHRLLDLASFTFEDNMNAEVREGWKEIRADLIAPVSISDRDALIVRNIEKWLDETGETPSQFLNVTRSRPEKVTRPFESSTLLDLLIQSLDARQLSTTTMSLDTVSTLLKKRV
jgi:hypothetical protein